jgi:small subunit ribosomal protein S4e
MITMSKHLKRLLAPRFWEIGLKENKFAVKPRPGPHPGERSIPLQVALRDILKIAESGREAKNIIKKRAVLVDGKARTDGKYPAGLMDVIEIPAVGAAYRVVPTGKGLGLLGIGGDEAKKKLCRIEKKIILPGGVVQLSTHDGRSLRLGVQGKGGAEKHKEHTEREYKEKECKDYRPGGSLLVELPSQKIIEHVGMEKGSMAVITQGRNAGKTVKIADIMPAGARGAPMALCQLDKERIEVSRAYLFVVGRTKPLVKLAE